MKIIYLIIAIAIIVALVVIFVVSFIINKKTPVPKGCEDLEVSDEKCKGCGHTECHFYKGEEAENG